MKRKIVIVSVAIAVILCLAGPGQALAAWVGSLRGEAQIQNPIDIIQFASPPVEIFPGQGYGFGGEIPNHSSEEYGLRAYGWIWWIWEETGEELKISLEEVSEEGAITIPAPILDKVSEDGGIGISTPTVAAGPPEIYLGTIELYIDGRWQSLGSVFNIEPGQVLEAQVVVTTSHSLEPGKVGAVVFFLRGAPAR